MSVIFSGKCEFERAGDFGAAYHTLADSIRNERFAAIAKTFSTNVDRVAFLGALPLQLIYWAGIMASTMCIARVRAGRAPDATGNDSSPEFLELWDKVFKERVAKTQSSAVRRIGATILDNISSWKVENIETNPAEDGIQAALAAMITATYAALEALAADLWIESVNQFPMLAQNWFEKNSEKQIPGNVLAGYAFNASSSMGLILHDTRRVTFEAWNDVKRAYSQAFKNEIDDAFEPADDLLKVEKTRHLFAHRGGVIDKQYKKQMENFPEYTGLTVGERLRLTGPVVRDHIKASVGCGVMLTKLVDDWAMNHK